MRVVSGEARGRPLRAPKNQSLTRPMADKIKEALFSSLASLGVIPERILDLYAGSGAVGIEALSRGGREVDFVDRDRRACEAIQKNLQSTGFENRGRIHRLPVRTFLAQVTNPYDFVIVDPPYANTDIVDLLDDISKSPAVEDKTIVVLGHWPRLEIPEKVGQLVRLKQRCHGDSCFAILDVVIENSPESS